LVVGDLVICVAEIARGVRNPLIRLLERIAQALGADVEELVRRK
jgi:transcriptional regulator with XRE-family HTH domain